MRTDRGRLLSVLAAGVRDLSLAEEALQDAVVSALAHWGRSGLPASPQGWLLTAARRKALDRLRAGGRQQRKAAELSAIMARQTTEPEQIPDERLRLIFACCHPALELKSRVALTLRTVCGITTPEIARLFLDDGPTMGQRISRAKAKIAKAGIPFSTPELEHWPARLDAVLTTIYLIFTTGFIAPPDEPRDLCREAEFLVRLIDSLHSGDPEVEGLLALILLTGARRSARIGADGASVPPGEQDRRLWDAARLNEGRGVLARAVTRGLPGPFQIKAAIADCQMAEGGPDWSQINALYHALLRHEPTDIVALNAAVAIAEAGEPATGLAVVEGLAGSLSGYQPWHAARAALLAMTGRIEDAALSYDRAIESAPGEAEALFLQKRKAALAPEGKPLTDRSRQSRRD
jgi:predicted RNA polymerase sigma factor